MPVHDPDSVEDYLWDFSSLLSDGETVSTAQALVDSGDIVIDSTENDTTTVTVWVSGGTLWSKAVVTARIVTSQARTFDRSRKFWIRPE